MRNKNAVNTERVYLIAVIVMAACLLTSCRPSDPLAEGAHWSYSISCENGFKYKSVDRGAILLLNSDGTPMRCK